MSPRDRDVEGRLQQEIDLAAAIRSSTAAKVKKIGNSQGRKKGVKRNGCCEPPEKRRGDDGPPGGY